MLSSTSDDEAECAISVRCFGEGEDHGRVAVQSEVESRGFKRLRRTHNERGSQNPPVQRIPTSKRVVLVPQSPQGTPESIQDVVCPSPSCPPVQVLFGSCRGHDCVRRRHCFEQRQFCPCRGPTTTGLERSLRWDRRRTPSLWNWKGNQTLRGIQVLSFLPEEEVLDVSPMNFTQHQREMNSAFRELDAWELRLLFECRAHVMKSVPFLLKGAFRAALRVAMEEISTGQERGDEQRQERRWKHFFLLPRMLLSRPPRGGLVPRKKLEARLNKFFSGQWKSLIDDRTFPVRLHWHECARGSGDRQAARAENLAMIGEPSAARQALELTGQAPGDRNTLNELRNRVWRPPTAREPLPPEVASRGPERLFNLDEEVFCRNLRSARRGVASGPSGMTCEHLQPTHFGVGQEHRSLVPCRNSRCQRLCAPDGSSSSANATPHRLKKPQGGARGIAVSDVFRRIIARTVAKQCAVAAEKATADFQFALRTRAVCECVSHVLQTLTDLDPTAIILSLDGVGAFDLVPRNAMLKGLLTVEGGDRVLPFVRLFYGDPSTFLWEDDLGGVHSVLQGEGGEQGDPLMPMLFSLGQHAALMAVAARLRVGSRSWTS